MRNRVTRSSSHLGKRAIVIGAGISGLAAARALADHFEEVVVFERDEFPSGATARPGAPQGKQAHGLLGGAMKALKSCFRTLRETLSRRERCRSITVVNFCWNFLAWIPFHGGSGTGLPTP